MTHADAPASPCPRLLGRRRVSAPESRKRPSPDPVKESSEGQGGAVMIELVRRWNVRRKLARGRCVNCQAVLRDDATDACCGDECAAEWADRTAY